MNLAIEKHAPKRYCTVDPRALLSLQPMIPPGCSGGLLDVFKVLFSKPTVQHIHVQRQRCQSAVVRNAAAVRGLLKA